MSERRGEVDEQRIQAPGERERCAAAAGVARAGSDQRSHIRPATKSRLSPSGPRRRARYVLSSRTGVGLGVEETCRCVSFSPRTVRTDRFGNVLHAHDELYPRRDAIWMNEFSSVSVGLLNQPRIGSHVERPGGPASSRRSRTAMPGSLA